jgi:hypothetical protein
LPAIIKYFSIALLIALLPLSCTKEEVPRIPYVYVDYYLYPNSLDYISVGSAVNYSGGYRGIVIYRFLENEFKVYERCCPYDPDKANAYVEIEAGGLTVVDSVCMSRYILYDGSPFEGPSGFALQQYHYSYNGDVLHIYN